MVGVVRFGDFQLDVRAAELRKRGVRIRLQEQSFQILVMLLDRPGDVVLREEIRRKLWPNNTIVEFDHSINAAIKRLRNALGESAEEPRYIETLAKRGYRFSGEVIQEQPKEKLVAVAEIAEGTEGLEGRTFSNYKLLGKLGEGGMGVVYRAEDLKLGRQVAVKFLTSELASDATARQRFEREVRAASALNHPGICAIYGYEDLGGQPAIVMELVEGETLEVRMARGGVPRKQALSLAIQIAGALAEAHRKGIVHRDLKPSNIMLTARSSWGVKVLDFGIAKMETGETALTRPGMVPGTLKYMSPEQAEGKPTDPRSDIYSLGVVLNEMLIGKGNEDGALSDPLERVVRRCLEQDREERWQSAKDLKTELEWIAGTTPRARQLRPPGAWMTQRLAWVIAGALAVGLAALALLHFREKSPAVAEPVRFQIPVEDVKDALLLSPDGRKLVRLAGGRLGVYYLESGQTRDLTAAEAWQPFWSPDSRVIGYWSEQKLKTIEVTGGPPQTVAETGGILWGCAAWNRDNVIVFGDRRVGLFRVPASGGVPVQITALNPAIHENSQFCPSFLPDGRHFVYIRASSEVGKSAIYLGSVDSKPEQQSLKPLVVSDSQAEYAPSADPSTGYLLFVREGTLVAQPFDNRRLELKGQAAPVAEHLSLYRGRATSVRFTVSENDILAFRAAATQRLAWFDREGNTLGTVGEPGQYNELALSPDGTRVATTLNSGADAVNIWMLDFSRGGATTRFSFGSKGDRFPVWSPDGTRVVFRSNRDGVPNLYQKPVNGAKDEELLLKSDEGKVPTSWSRDGRFLLYTTLSPRTKSDIWVLPLGPSRQPIPFLITEFNESDAHFSPDGRWVAYTSDESGQAEVYVRSFSINSAGTAVETGGKWSISNGAGEDPRWRSDGRELYYRSPDGKVMAVDITTRPAFRAGTPHRLGGLTLPFGWDSAADGQRFLGYVAESVPPPYTIVLNWQAALKKK